MSEEKNKALEQKEEVKEETLEDNAKEENEDAQVDEASFPGAGKNKEPMKQAPEKAKETGVNNEVPDGPKPDFTKGVPTAKKRPADKGKVSESASKMSLIKSIYDKLDEMSKEEVAEILGALNEVEDVEFDEEGNEIVSENKETKEVVAREEFNLESDVKALIEGEELSDEFKEKAATIFEAAVFARVNDEISTRIDKLDEQYKTELQEAIENNRTVMIEKVDDFMNYVVKEWMQENELAVDKGIRSEIVEDFMVGLKNLFVEHYVDIPDEKVDLVDDLFAKVEDLEGSLNSEIQKNIDSSKELKEYKKMDALYTVSEGMTEVDQEKMIKLAEGIEYENEESYTEKLQIIKDKYFRAEDAEEKQVLSEDTQDDMEPNEDNSSDDVMAEAPENIKQYATAISRTIIK
jgi:hypothetical protein